GAACRISASATATLDGGKLWLARSTHAFQRRKPRCHTLTLNAPSRPEEEEAAEARLVRRRRRSAASFSGEEESEVSNASTSATTLLRSVRRPACGGGCRYSGESSEIFMG